MKRYRSSYFIGFEGETFDQVVIISSGYSTMVEAIEAISYKMLSSHYSAVRSFNLFTNDGIILHNFKRE